MPDNKPTIVTIYPQFDERAPISIIYADRRPQDSPQCLKGTMGKDWMPNILSQNFVRERWN